MIEALQIPGPLVSAQWLHQYKDAPNLIILDATLPKVTVKKPQKDSIKRQIPNARFFDIKNTFSDLNGAFPNTMLSATDFEDQAQRLGIHKDSCIVVYDDHGIYSAPRAWWSFKSVGFNNIAVLNGGLPHWIAAGFETELPMERNYQHGNFRSEYHEGMFVASEDVLASIENRSHLILDARSAGRFLGTDEEPREGVRSGHIPGSRSFPYSGILIDGCLKSEVELREMFTAVNPDSNKMTFSCGTGITACVLALGAEVSGYSDINVYDGSWTEWGSLLDLPIEK